MKIYIHTGHSHVKNKLLTLQTRSKRKVKGMRPLFTKSRIKIKQGIFGRFVYFEDRTFSGGTHSNNHFLVYVNSEHNQDHSTYK